MVGDGKREFMAGEHGFDGVGVALGKPHALGVFVHDEEIAIAIPAAEEDNGVVGEAVVQSGNPFDGAGFVEVVNDVNLAAKVGEELADGYVPIAIAPGAPLPTGQAGEDFGIFRVVKAVVAHLCRNKAGLGLGFGLVRRDEPIAIPGVANAARIGGGVETGPPGLPVGEGF